MILKKLFVSILGGAIIATSSMFPTGLLTNAIAQGDDNWRTFISPEYKLK